MIFGKQCWEKNTHLAKVWFDFSLPNAIFFTLAFKHYFTYTIEAPLSIFFQGYFFDLALNVSFDYEIPIGRKVDCLPHFKNENWITSLTGSKILLTARKVRLPARLVFKVVSIFTTPRNFSQELPCVCTHSSQRPFIYS